MLATEKGTALPDPNDGCAHEECTRPGWVFLSPRSWPGVPPGRRDSCHAGRVHLLVVEDDQGIAEPLVEGLRREGFEVTWVGTGAEALAAGPVDMVLLDLGLPDMDGYRVCQEIRAESSVPIIVVTARGAEVDKVVGLELGADDYLAKPFGIRELVARIRAVRRRIEAPPAPAASERPQQLGRLTIDRRTRRVLIDGEEQALTPKEFDLLALLANDPGAVVTRQQILEEVWDPHWYGPTKTVDVHVASLRRKLGHPEWVETVRGVGLRLGPALAGAGRGIGAQAAPAPGETGA
jgi:two-component system response regulator RegX3